MTLSLRIRHPSIDPQEISTALGLTPEHAFKVGEARSAAVVGGSISRYTESYWLAPITAGAKASWSEPAFLTAIASTRGTTIDAIEEKIRHAKQTLDGGLEAKLLQTLMQLDSHRDFLQRLRSEGAEIALLIPLSSEDTAAFKLPLPMSRLIVKLGIDLEFDAD